MVDDTRLTAMRSVSEIEQALRANGDGAVVRIQQQCQELRHDVEQWSLFTLGVVEALARAGIEEEFVWSLLNRLGPKSPFEEEWRAARFRILEEIALWEGSSKEDMGVAAILAVSDKLVATGLDRKTANLVAIRQSKTVGIKLRSDPVRLSSAAMKILEGLDATKG